MRDATDIEEQWALFRKAVSESAEDVVGRRRGSQKEQWIQDNMWVIIDQRKTVKQKREQANTCTQKEQAAIKYKELDHAVKRSCRADKKVWLNQKGTEAEEAAQQNDPKTLFHVVKDLMGTNSNSSVPVKGKNGKTTDGRGTKCTMGGAF